MEEPIVAGQAPDFAAEDPAVCMLVTFRLFGVPNSPGREIVSRVEQAISDAVNDHIGGPAPEYELGCYTGGTWDRLG